MVVDGPGMATKKGSLDMWWKEAERRGLHPRLAVFALGQSKRHPRCLP